MRKKDTGGLASAVITMVLREKKANSKKRWCQPPGGKGGGRQIKMTQDDS